MAFLQHAARAGPHDPFLPIPYSVARDCWTHIGFVYA